MQILLDPRQPDGQKELVGGACRKFSHSQRASIVATHQQFLRTILGINLQTFKHTPRHARKNRRGQGKDRPLMLLSVGLDRGA